MSSASRLRQKKLSAKKSNVGAKTNRRVLSRPATSKVQEVGQPIPSWAAESVFKFAGMAAWEGTTEQLNAANVYPLSSPLLSQLHLVQKNGSLNWIEAIHPLDKNRVIRTFQQLTAAPFSMDYRLVLATGEFIWIRHSVVALEFSGNVRLARGFVRDIQNEKELELESLRISEREQNRIGQDLHDDLCQVLAGVSCLMRVAEGRLSAKVPEEVPAITELNQQIIDAMHRTRALTHGLFPGKVQIADVRGALIELTRQVQARFQVEVKTQFVGRFPHHTTDQIIQVYRLTQEAISNAIKHGRATCIEVRLEALNANMSLSITDNGTGLSQNEPSENGVGHHIMQYRTRTLGGELSIRNAPVRGVTVNLTYPFLH